MGEPKLETMNPLLDKRFVNAFIEGVIKTISTMANTTIKTGKPAVDKAFTSKGEIAGMVGMVAGPMKGTMSISFSQKGICQIVENMIGEKYEKISPEVKDAVGEITNQIYGAAKTSLNQMGYQFEMAIPSVIEGTITVSKYHNGATLVLPFNLDNGETFYVDITVT